MSVEFNVSFEEQSQTFTAGFSDTVISTSGVEDVLVDDVSVVGTDHIANINGMASKTWVQGQGYLTDHNVFVATYGTTTASAIATAITAGKAIFCNYTDGGVVHQLMLVDATDGKYGFAESTVGTNSGITSVSGIVVSLAIDTDTWSVSSGSSSIPTKTSDLTNDSGFLTQHQDISGKADKRTIKTTMDAVAVSGCDYFLGTQTVVATTLPSTPSVGDLISIVFYSGSTATTFAISGNTIGGVPTPSTNERIEVNMLFDGSYWCVVSSVVEVE